MWSDKPRVGLVAVYAPMEVGWQEAPRLLEQAHAALKGLPLDVVPVPQPVFDVSTALQAAEALSKAHAEAVVWLAATWAHDSLAVDFLRSCPVPLVAWGIPGMDTGSLCGSQQLVEVLTELGHPREFVHGPIDHADVQAHIMSAARASAAASRLKKARFGMLGHRTIGMMEVTFHEYDLFEQFGALVRFKGADELRAAMDAADAGDAQAIWVQTKSRCGLCNADDTSGVIAARCYLALRAWIDTDRLAGIAVGCYPDLMGIACLACGWLAEEGMVTSCEGDMNSLILTAAMHLMSGRPVHNTDLLFADEHDNTCTMSHCGSSAISLAGDPKSVRLERVRLMEHGVAAHYSGVPGRVTLANLCGRKGTYRLTRYTGEAVPTGMVFPGIPVKVRLDVPLEQFLTETADFGTGHHWMVAYGDLSRPLQQFARMTRLKMFP